jgi:hypothetical protein
MSVLVFHPNGTFTKKASLAIAATANDCIGKTVVVATPQTITTAITWPIDRSLVVQAGGSFSFTGSGALTGLPEADPHWFGAKGDGTTDDTAAFQLAVAAAQIITLPKASYLVGAVTLAAKNIWVKGDNATITSAGAGSIFIQQNRGYLFEMSGVDFVGAKIAFDYQAQDITPPTAYAGQLWEFNIRDCRFLQDAGTYGIRLYGAREGVISRCHFETCDGIYREYAINTDIVSCNFKNTAYGINNAPYSEGLKVIGGSMLGVGVGIKGVGPSIGYQIIGAMIDFCDQPVYMDSCGQINITGCYISSRSAQPIINMVNTGGTAPSDLNIVGNTFYVTATSPGAEGLRFIGATHLNLSSNTISGKYTNGLVLGAVLNSSINNNSIFSSGAGLKSISTADGSSTTYIKDNSLGEAITGITNEVVKNNKGYLTTNKGTATILSGQGTVVVTHGLAITPSTTNMLIMQNSYSAAANHQFWLHTVTSTTFTISTEINVGADTAFSWQII